MSSKPQADRSLALAKRKIVAVPPPKFVVRMVYDLEISASASSTCKDLDFILQEGLPGRIPGGSEEGQQAWALIQVTVY